MITDLDRGIEPLSLPLIEVVGGSAGDRDQFLARQTTTDEVAESRTAPFLFPFQAGLDDAPATLLESLLFALVAEDLGFARAGWSSPGKPGRRFGSNLGAFVENEALLLQMPKGPLNEEVLGASVTHINRPMGKEVEIPLVASSGRYYLRDDLAAGRVVRRRVRDVASSLRNLPEVPGPGTVMFLLPYLALGGAERLLLDLLEGLRERYRLLVVTLDPHLQSLGESVSKCRELTPHVYTLGDWLPPEARWGVLRHLLRRYRVFSLVSWNGTVLFFDEVAELRREFPELRILNQVYNHQGAWIDRTSREVSAVVDIHLAINRRIVLAFKQRAAPDEKIALVYHGVRVPERIDSARRRQAQCERRRELHLPENGIVVGTFARMHPQKRTLDVLELALRMGPDFHFLLVGGGPLENEIDQRLRDYPLANLVRLPFTDPIEPLFDALDICLLPSEFEGLPVFLLEGLARGIPCVATAVGDIPYLLSDGGGIVVDKPGDLEGLARALEQLADASYREEEGAAGRERILQEFDLQRFRERYEELIFPSRSEA